MLEKGNYACCLLATLAQARGASNEKKANLAQNKKKRQIPYIQYN